jgi:hypothetical protein
MRGIRTTPTHLPMFRSISSLLFIQPLHQCQNAVQNEIRNGGAAIA